MLTGCLHISRERFYVILLLCLSNWLVIPTAVSASPVQQEKETAATELQAALDDEDFVYQRGGRSDPFRPFVSAERIKREEALEEKELTGMQIFEPGQLTLVAIVFIGKEPRAMVQDAVGKGYIIKKGMEIGRYGIVENIIPNKVLIKEKIPMRNRKDKIKTVEMVLKKEGEKAL